MECQDGLKLVSYSSFLLASQGAYFTLSKTTADFILKKLAWNGLRAEPWPSTCSSVETQHKTVEVVSNCAMLKRKLKQKLSDTCSICNRLAHDSLMQGVRHHCLLPQRLGTVAEETEEK